MLLRAFYLRDDCREGQNWEAFFEKFGKSA